jgi:GntP family gluconate:H+ symporter
MTHSLVPPTPGPLIVAGELGVDLGRMIVGGILVGLVGMTGAFAYARWFNANHPIELRGNSHEKESKFLRLAETPNEQLPSLLSSVVPILVPVLLLAGKSLLLQFSESLQAKGLGEVLDVFILLGDKNIALTLGALLALHQLFKSKLSSKLDLSKSVKSSLQGAGVIILITGMGGAFGGILQQTSLGLEVSNFVSSHKFGPISILIVAYFTTSVIRIAQGSGTVAMVTSIGIIGGLVEHGIGIHPIYLALAIGCGVKPIPWMNDSGFWVVGKLAGFTEAETFKTFSIVIALQGLFGGLAVLALAYFFPQFIF